MKAFIGVKNVAKWRKINTHNKTFNLYHNEQNFILILLEISLVSHLWSPSLFKFYNEGMKGY